MSKVESELQKAAAGVRDAQRNIEVTEDTAKKQYDEVLQCQKELEIAKVQHNETLAQLKAYRVQLELRLQFVRGLVGFNSGYEDNSFCGKNLSNSIK